MGLSFDCSQHRAEQIRVIDSGSGYLCQMEPVAHFGLGSDNQVAEVTVEWPDGARVVLDRPDADQVLDVPYPLEGVEP